MMLAGESKRTGRRVALIRGVGSHNGGAELMLFAASQWCHANGYTPVVDRRDVARSLRKQWHLGAYIDIVRLGALHGLGVSLLPTGLANRVRLATRRHVSVVLDASGFYLGDEWDADWIESVAALYERWASDGAQIVMLPQAFGPFSDERMASAAKKLLGAARVIYARDEQSLEHVTSLLDSARKVRIAPDFTLAVSAIPAIKSRTQMIAIVPNVNILRRPNVTESAYVRSLAKMCELLSEAGVRPVMLVHSSKGDPRLASSVAAITDVTVLSPEDGLKAKSIIAGCSGVIGARFHALASALSSGVPVVAHSWSHKYSELLTDFNWDGHVADPLDAQGSVETMVRALSDSTSRQRILQAGDKLKAESRDMWSAIRTELSSPTARVPNA